LDRLTEVHDGVRADTYRYNGDGALVTAVRSGTEVRYVLDTAVRMPHILAETNAAGIIQRYYVHGNGLLYALEAPDDTISHYHYDAIGSTLALTDVIEVVTDKYAYGPYGEATSSSGSSPNQFRYVGRFGVMKEDNGLMFMRARFYDFSIKRFISKDAIRLSRETELASNLYSYVEGNPIGFIDPEGLIRWGQLLWGVAEVGMGAISTGVGATTAIAAGWTGVGALFGGTQIILGVSQACKGYSDIIAGLREDELVTYSGIQESTGYWYEKLSRDKFTEEGKQLSYDISGFLESGVGIIVSLKSIQKAKISSFSRGFRDTDSGKFISKKEALWRVFKGFYNYWRALDNIKKIIDIQNHYNSQQASILYSLQPAFNFNRGKM
jgi:RHS repeat-associated protein